MDNDILTELERDLSYARQCRTLHSIVRLSVGEAAIAEIKKLRQQIEGHVNRIAAQSEIITNLMQQRCNSAGVLIKDRCVSTPIVDCTSFPENKCEGVMAGDMN